MIVVRLCSMQLMYALFINGAIFLNLISNIVECKCISSGCFAFLRCHDHGILLLRVMLEHLVVCFTVFLLIIHNLIYSMYLVDSLVPLFGLPRWTTMFVVLGCILFKHWSA